MSEGGDPMDRLAPILDAIRERLDSTDAAREQAYRLQRDVTRAAASTIRAAHRRAWDEAHELLGQCRELTARMNAAASGTPAIYHAGYVMDAQKEFVEAALVVAMLTEQALPDLEALGVEPAPYLNGLAEASTELRRSVLDALQRHEFESARALVDRIESVYELLVTFDYPDSISYGLKRRLDTVRAVLERTQSDVLTTVREAELQEALERVEARLRERG